MGLFFAPLLSMITLIKLFLIFYIRLTYLKRLCVPPKSFFEASRTSSLLNIFLLVSFVFSVIPMAYIIGAMQPSNACGPFRSSSDVHYYTGVVWNLVNVSSLSLPELNELESFVGLEWRGWTIILLVYFQNFCFNGNYSRWILIHPSSCRNQFSFLVFSDSAGQLLHLLELHSHEGIQFQDWETAQGYQHWDQKAN